MLAVPKQDVGDHGLNIFPDATSAGLRWVHANHFPNGGSSYPGFGRIARSRSSQHDIARSSQVVREEARDRGGVCQCNGRDSMISNGIN